MEGEGGGGANRTSASRGTNGVFEEVLGGWGVVGWDISPGRGGLELVLSVQHTSFPVAPVGRMFSWVS